MNGSEILRVVYDLVPSVSEYSRDELDSIDLSSFGDCCLVDIGLNSVDYAVLASMINERLGVDISLYAFSKTNKIGDIVDMLSCAVARSRGDRLSYV